MMPTPDDVRRAEQRGLELRQELLARYEYREVESETRECKVCHRIQSITEFYRLERNLRRHICRTCKANAQATWRMQNASTQARI